MLAHVGRPAKVTFGCGPIAVLESETRLVTKYATLQNPKAIHHQSRKGGGLRMSCFRTRGTFESAPDDAQSPGQWYAVCAPTAGGLVRLVLRVLDWYTSCSSLNLPSAEYAGDTVRKCESGNPSLAGSYESVISLIDAGQRSGYAESNACLRGITSPTSRSESSFGYVFDMWRLTGAGAVAAEPPKTSQSRRGAAVEPTLNASAGRQSLESERSRRAAAVARRFASAAPPLFM